MIRYYLVPFETDEEKLIADAQPMHLDVFGKASGLISKPVSKDGSITTAWREEYYIVCVERENVSEYDKIEGLKEVIRLDANTELSELSKKKIDTSLVSNRDDMDRAVTKWLIDDEKILSEVLNPIVKKEAKSGIR